MEKLTSITRKYLVLNGLSVLFSTLILLLLNVAQQTQLYEISELVIVSDTTLIIKSNRIPKNKYIVNGVLNAFCVVHYILNHNWNCQNDNHP